MTKLTLGYGIGSNACKRHGMIKSTDLDGWLYRWLVIPIGPCYLHSNSVSCYTIKFSCLRVRIRNQLSPNVGYEKSF
jgi:hypothetical protein